MAKRRIDDARCTVVTTFGCTKHAMVFRYLKLRGLHGAQTEWQLVCLAWSLKGLFKLRGDESTQTLEKGKKCKKCGAEMP